MYPRFVLKSASPGDSRVFELHKTRVTFGRAAAADYRLGRDHASRLHAEISVQRVSQDSMNTIAVRNAQGEREDWRVQLKDCTSLCGTLLDGRKLLPDISVCLPLNAVLTFGLKERFRFTLAPGVELVKTTPNGREAKSVVFVISGSEDAAVLKRIAPFTWHSLSLFAISDPNFRLEKITVTDDDGHTVGEFVRFRPDALTQAQACFARLVPGFKVEFMFEQNSAGWCQNDSSRPAVKVDELFAAHQNTADHFTCILE